MGGDGGCLVSILVLLEVPLQHLKARIKELEAQLFQSLFYWKYHFNAGG